MAALASVEYWCSDLRWCYLQQTVHLFFCQSDPHAVIPNKLAFPMSPLLDLQIYFEDSELKNLCTNTIQINISPEHL